MSDRAMLSPWASVRVEELRQLIERGRARGELTLDEVLHVFQSVELDEDVIERVRDLLRAEGITLDESVEELESELRAGGPALLAPPVVASDPGTGGELTAGDVSGGDVGDPPA